MVLNNLFMRLCKYCSEEAGSIDWCVDMSLATLFLSAIMGFIAIMIAYTYKIQEGVLPGLYVFSGAISILCVATTILYLICMIFVVKDEEKHYLSIKLSSIFINFLLGFNFYVMARYIMIGEGTVITQPAEIIREEFLLIFMMILCLILMLIGLKKNILSGALAMLYHTRKSGKKVDNYAPYYVAALVGMSFGAGTLRFGFDLDRIFYAFIGGVTMLFGAYIMISCILSLIYFFVQIKHPELRRDE